MKINIGSRIKVFPADVILFESDINYTNVYLENGDKFLVSTNLKKIEERFAEFTNFFRPNRSFLINLNFAEFSAENSELRLRNERFVAVSRRKMPLLLNLIQHIQ